MRALLLLLLIAGIVLSKPRIVVEDPWVREVPPVSTMSAAFMKIKNIGDEKDYLIGVKTDASQIAEIHTTVMEEGMMKMRRLDRVEIPAGGTVEFKPMGKHIMLINLKRPLKAGEKVRITLVFEKSGEITVSAPVKSMRVR